MKTIKYVVLTLLLLVTQGFAGTTVANAGVDQVLNITPSNRAIYLDGTASTSDTTIVSYEWFEGDKFIGPNESRWYVLTESGVHTIKLVVTDSEGVKSEDTMTVTVNKSLIAEAGQNQTLNITPSNRAVHLNGSASVSDAEIVKYEWFEGDDFIGPNVSRWYVLTESGQHTIKLVITDAEGATAEDTMVVTVNKSLIAEAGQNKTLNITPSNTAVYLDGSLSVSDADIEKYEWFENGVFIGPNVSRWYVITENGAHTITLKITDVNGAVSEDTVVVHVSGAPEPE